MIFICKSRSLLEVPGLQQIHHCCVKYQAPSSPLSFQYGALFTDPLIHLQFKSGVTISFSYLLIFLSPRQMPWTVGNGSSNQGTVGRVG